MTEVPKYESEGRPQQGQYRGNKFNLYHLAAAPAHRKQQQNQKVGGEVLHPLPNGAPTQLQAHLQGNSGAVRLL
jgi:hypothetical protein